MIQDYKKIANMFNGKHSENTKEWHYITSDFNRNKNLIKALYENNLLPNEVNICDCGIGLGEALFDIYLQSLEFNQIKFNFFGIEKNKEYTNFVSDKLLHFWDQKLKIIHSDLTIQNFTNYNIIYSYLPFRENKKLYDFYFRMSKDLKPETIVIENSEMGINLLEKITHLQKLEIDGLIIFKKFN